ncbi:putative ATPase [Streptomyces sp. V3I8]|uniref:ATP-binding protein n=1 Tax=Streptomyces sp. V3I8 TaxID=3042279 RepID=UPI00277EE9EA|nr:AAA family ATPase [Streptomyces sp. V3I8]MDQ1041113.1 putative ATPase [Streptomyces sp. V3I8]
MLNNLPELPDGLVGRREELAHVTAALGRHRLVVLTGVGGVGKSRLALHAAEQLARSGTRGVAWADLWPLTSDRLLLATVADALDFADHATAEPLDALCGWLTDRDVLLVLDSCEHLSAACRGLLARILDDCPAVTVLATSREPLGMDGEHQVVVDPLPPETDAAELFRRRALETGTGPVAADDLGTVVRLCRRLEGIPLALELAAGQLAHRTLREVEDDLGSRLDLVAESPVAGHFRHRTLRTTIGWSHELCTPAERLLWARFAAFRAPVDADAVRAVCTDDVLRAADAERALAALEQKSVVSRVDGRFHMLDTLREYGRMWLGELGETTRLSERHAAYFLRRARRAHADWLGPAQIEAYRWVSSAHADLCAGLEHFLATRPQQALELSGVLALFWSCCGHLRETTGYLEEALALTDRPGAVRTRALWALGVARVLCGEQEVAHRLALECERQAAAQGETEGTLHAAYLLGLVHLMEGRPMAARFVVDGALESVRGRPFDSVGRVLCRLVRIFGLTGEGLREEARREARELRRGCAERGEWWTRSYADYQLALLALFEDRPEEAAGHATSMLDGKRLIGDSFGIALGLDLLASALAAQGAGEPAVAAYGAGENYWAAVGHPQRGTPELGPVRERYETAARSLLGDSGYDKALLDSVLRDPEAVLRELLDRTT